MRQKYIVITIVGAVIALFVWLMKSKETPLYIYPQLRHGITLEVMEEGTRLTFLRAEPRYVLHISRKRSSYGHDVDISLYNYDEEMIAYLRKGRVVEDDNGITFTQASGHAVFVPRQWYEGGR